MPILLVGRVPLECISSGEGLHTQDTAHTVLNTELWAVHPELLLQLDWEGDILSSWHGIRSPCSDAVPSWARRRDPKA